MSVADAPLLRGLTWDGLAADTRPQRLKHGKHFAGEPRELEAAAVAAAQARGQAVRTLRDELGRRTRYVWLQFAHASVPLGDPCPVCDGTRLLRTTEHFATCERCGSRLLLTAPRPAPGSAGARASAHVRRRHLSGYTDVELVREDWACNETAERFWGRGHNADGVAMLLQVEYPLRDGKRIPDPEAEGEHLHTVRFWRLSALQRAARMGMLDDWPPEG